MKYAWKSLVMVPVLLLPVVLTRAQETCPDGGIGGGNTNNGQNTACCLSECGSCGGSGCGSFSGGKESCCISEIMAAGNLCSEIGTAPCVLTGASEPESEPEDDNNSADDGGGGGGSEEGSGFTGGQYGQTYGGDSTYYGFTTGGNCAFGNNVPRMYDDMIPMALNEPQYGLAADMCGACVEGSATGSGAGGNPPPEFFRGYISDKCPGCLHSDLDFALDGDGRFGITWRFIECPGEELYFVAEEVQGFYWKIQALGSRTPVESLTIGGEQAQKTDDNHFILQNNSGIPWPGTRTIETRTQAGVVETNEVSFY